MIWQSWAFEGAWIRFYTCSRSTSPLCQRGSSMNPANNSSNDKQALTDETVKQQNSPSNITLHNISENKQRNTNRTWQVQNPELPATLWSEQESPACRNVAYSISIALNPKSVSNEGKDLQPDLNEHSFDNYLVNLLEALQPFFCQVSFHKQCLALVRLFLSDCLQVRQVATKCKTDHIRQ